MKAHLRVGVRCWVLALAALAALSATGCNTAPGFVGKWKTDRTALLNSPSGENDLAALLSPVPKFSVAFTEQGVCTSTWTGDDGKDASRTGTWKMVEDQGLKWRITLKMENDEEDWAVKVGSPDSYTISLESEDAFRKGGPIFFKKS